MALIYRRTCRYQLLRINKPFHQLLLNPTAQHTADLLHDLSLELSSGDMTYLEPNIEAIGYADSERMAW